MIRLGFIGSATYELMPALSRSLQADLPILQVELKGELLSPEVEAALLERRIDLGVLRPFDVPDGIQVRTLRAEPLVAAVPVDHPAAARAPWRWRRWRPNRSSTMCARAVLWPTRWPAPAWRPVSSRRCGWKSARRRRWCRSSRPGSGSRSCPQSVQSVRIPGVVYLPL